MVEYCSCTVLQTVAGRRQNPGFVTTQADSTSHLRLHTPSCTCSAVARLGGTKAESAAAVSRLARLRSAMPSMPLWPPWSAVAFLHRLESKPPFTARPCSLRVTHTRGRGSNLSFTPGALCTAAVTFDTSEFAAVVHRDGQTDASVEQARCKAAYALPFSAEQSNCEGQSKTRAQGRCKLCTAQNWIGRRCGSWPSGLRHTKHENRAQSS